MSYYWKTFVVFFSFFISCYAIFSLLSSKKWKTKTTSTCNFVFNKFWQILPSINLLFLKKSMCHYIPLELYSLLNVWLRSTMFYDNAINRVYGKKRGPHYTTLKKNYPWGSDFEPNQSKIYFFCCVALRASKIWYVDKSNA